MLRAVGVNDGNMEEGSLRCDANVSMRPVGTSTLGVKVEVKNINSFRFLQRALDYEFTRQRELLERGGTVVQETRLWDTAAGCTFSMRSKEEAHDYRYFPEPDLPPLVVSDEWVASIRDALPELPDERKRRFVDQYGLSAQDAGWLAQTADVAQYFEAVAEASGNPKAASNWVMGEVSRYLNEQHVEIDALSVTPADVGALIKLVDANTISASVAKSVFDKMTTTGRAPGAIVEAEGLAQIDDRDVLDDAVQAALAAHPDAVASYRGGKKGTLGFLVGQVMRETGGKADPKVVQQLLREKTAG